MSTLGPVLDLSSGGLRVLATRPPRHEKVELGLRSGEVALTLQAKVAWNHRLGFRRHEIGLTFINVGEDVAQILNRISTDHRARQAG